MSRVLLKLVLLVGSLTTEFYKTNGYAPKIKKSNGDAFRKHMKTLDGVLSQAVHPAFTRSHYIYFGRACVCVACQ